VTDESGETYAGPGDLSERQLLERAVRMLGHIDVMVHECHQVITTAAPLLDKWGGFLTAGGVGEFLSTTRAARRARKGDKAGTNGG
jgi:hypothetical protein